MKTKRIFAGILSTAVCVSMLAACGGSGTNDQNSQTKQNEQSSQTEQVSQDSQTEQNSEKPNDESSTPDEKPAAPKMHTLYIRDAGKSAELTATFINSVSGKSEDISMTKVNEGDDYITYSCEADTTLYNMVHITSGEDTTMDVSFNSFVSGWYLNKNYMLPYSEGKEPEYDPVFDTKVFQFEGNDKNVYIWKPDDYDEKSAEKYSTIYMFDGQSVLATGKDRGMDNDLECWNVSENVESMMNVTDNKAIIVAIETNGTTRFDELIPDLGEIAAVGLETKKKGSAFADFVCDTIVPYVQENYNVYTDAEHTTLAGSSLGGLETFYTCLAHPEIFSVGGVMSASFQAFDENTWTAFLTEKLNLNNLPFLYIYAGGYATDNGNVTEAMYNALVENGYPKDKIVFSKYEKGEHFMAYWRNIYSEFLEAAFTQNVTALECGAAVNYVDKTNPYEINIEDISVDENDTRPAEIRNYIYFDNSETKWEKVFAYWWGGKPVNIATNELYYQDWPGYEMQQIEGTDIYRILAPLGATNIIFDSGVTDAEVLDGVTAYQTIDLPYNIAMLGQIYKIDITQEPKRGVGGEKTKFRYPAGTWSRYDG